MQLDRTPESDAFASWLLDVSAGSITTSNNNSIHLPANMYLPANTVESLTDTIYPGIAEGDKPDNYFLHYTILSLKNNTVNDINQSILNRFSGQETVVQSTDQVI